MLRVPGFWSELVSRQHNSFAPLALRPGLGVLDVGCGTGDVLRLLAPIVSPGEAVGLDLSETMIAEATQRSQEAPIMFPSAQEIVLGGLLFQSAVTSQRRVAVSRGDPPP